jgi:hypothetical protein
MRTLNTLRVLPLALLVAYCGGRTPIQTPGSTTAVDIGQLWMEPHDLEARDLFHGAGGAALAPDTSAPFELIRVDNTGFSPGFDVRDGDGTVWSVKLGIEAQPEVVAARVLWAVGYHQPPVYLLKSWTLSGDEPATHGMSRFRRDEADQKVVADWSWYENPFVGTRPFKGLLVANLILNNWDLKDSNNKIYDVPAGERGRRRSYVVRDLGASLGKTSFPALLAWPPFNAMAQGSRNDLDDFEDQDFIRDVDGQRVRFEYRGIHGNLLDTLTADDVVWTCGLLARLSDRQWRDAFRAGGYDDAVRERYIAKLKSKIGEGLALQRRQAELATSRR